MMIVGDIYVTNCGRVFRMVKKSSAWFPFKGRHRKYYVYDAFELYRNNTTGVFGQIDQVTFRFNADGVFMDAFSTGHSHRSLHQSDSVGGGLDIVTYENEWSRVVAAFKRLEKADEEKTKAV